MGLLEQQVEASPSWLKLFLALWMSPMGELRLTTEVNHLTLNDNLTLSDISKISLGQVRSELGVIAQDPILLSGTLRSNLDLDGVYLDQELYDVLQQVQLIERVNFNDSWSESGHSQTLTSEDSQNISLRLDTVIKAGGEKWVAKSSSCCTYIDN